MKNKLLFILICIVCVLNTNVLCQNKKTDTIKVSRRREILDSIRAIQKIESIDYLSIVSLDTLYVIDREGAMIFQNADSNSFQIGKYNYGDKIEVIEIKNDWIGVPERVHREYDINGKKIEVWAWEKVFVNRASLGQVEEIKLVEKDLYEINCLYDTINLKNDILIYSLDSNIKIDNFIDIELIDKSLFENKQKTARDFLIMDTNKVKKKKDILVLKCYEMKRKFKDDQVGDTGKNYFYIGRVDALNQYLIYREYWEYYNFQFIDMTTCDITQTFQDLPYISPDQRHIISLHPDIYLGHTLLELFTINENKINFVVGACFTNWMPLTEKNDRFWANDGYFYAKVSHVKCYWENDYENNGFQYIRIKIK
jgi:hypothetical protein